ncbi:MAG: choice-of-anchor Q domain-containing protein, partial [Pirellulales bacterium]
MFRRTHRASVDCIMNAKRGYGRRLFVEALEERAMLTAYVVNSALDGPILVDGNLTLREAITAANTNSAQGDAPAGMAGLDMITFAATLNGATVLLNPTGSGVGALPTIIDSLTIDASALASGITIKANDPSAAAGDGIRIFNINNSDATLIDVTLKGLTLTGGDVSGSGGAISSRENLTISNSTITGNKATTSGGGVHQLTGILNTISGSLTIGNSTISGNSTIQNGGGVHAYLTTSVSITDSSITGNTAGEGNNYNGGGVFLFNNSAATITNSTISGNKASNDGGGVSAVVNNGQTLAIGYSTITRNISDSDTNGAGSGGGIYLRGVIGGNGTADFKNTIIAGNTDFSNVAPDIDNTTNVDSVLITQAYTLVGNNKGSGLAAGGLIGTPAAPINPLLAALTNNGGPTRTHALLNGSPAINTGDPAAVAGMLDVPTFDQRGTPFTRVAGGRIDIGAFELVPPPTMPTMMLLPSSDTGMFNNDRVTNKMQPAFGGVGPADRPVFVYAQQNDSQGLPLGDPFIVGTGVVGSDGTDGVLGNGLGAWEVTVEPLADGKYNFFARFDILVSDGDGGFIHILSEAVGDTPRTFTFTGPLNIPDGGAAVAPVEVTGMPLFVADVNVTVNINHPNVGDLVLTLISPSGTPILLSNMRGGTGDNFTGTVFDDSATNSIAGIVPGQNPFTGRFVPEEPLSTLFSEPANGTWRLFVTDTVATNAGQIINWTLSISSPIMVVIDTVEPNTPFLDLLDDTGRSSVDNVTKDNTPNVSMTTTDPNIALAQLMFTDNLKFRIYDRYQSSAQEVLIYDSALDTAADNVMTPGDMFTFLTQLTKTLPQLTPVNPAIVNGALADGVHNLKLEVEDRAGNISHDYFLQITVDTTVPKVSFGLPTIGTTNLTDGLHASSDTGVTTAPATFADRITSDSTPRLWGRAEANSVVKVYLDKNANGILDLTTDVFLGQTVATPYDGNDAFVDNAGNPLGIWEIGSVLDLNQILGVPKDGLRRLLVSAEDVAGNPMPTSVLDLPVIAQGLDSLHIFIDTQGPQVTGVTINNLTATQYNLFDPKPSTTGFTPLVSSLKIAVRDLPSRVDQNGAANINDFLYVALQPEQAQAAGNYLLVGDHVGVIAIQSIQLANPGAAQTSGNLTAVASTSTVSVGSFVGAAVQPEVGDYVLLNNGPAAGQVRRITSYTAATGTMTFDTPLLNLPAVGNSITVTKFATAVITLNFSTPLPDDRYTLTVRDGLVDPANNKLDGESHAIEPQGNPFFPSGDGVPGGNFVARFTIDSRPEIGNYVSQHINIDINGNFIWDPGSVPVGGDATNVDLSFTLPVQNANGSVGLGGFNVHDLLFVGKFFQPNGAVSRHFDQLAAYGYSSQLGVYRWIIDTNSNGVVTIGTDINTVQPTLGNTFNVAGAIPVAGNFDNNAANGDEIGLYNAGKWYLDTNRNFVIGAGDTLLTTNLLGHPIVGDFDGDGKDDLAVFNSNVFSFNLANDGFGDANDATITWGFPGVLDRPIAADMDQDGIDDIGLWVPRSDAS